MQETIEKPSDNFQSVMPDLTGYLTNTSANGSFDMTGKVALKSHDNFLICIPFSSFFGNSYNFRGPTKHSV